MGDPATSRGGALRWRRLTFTARAEQAPALSEVLAGAGALSVSLSDAREQPLYEPEPGAMPLWEKTQVCALFGAEADIEKVLTAVREALPRDEFPAHRVHVIVDRAWEREWSHDLRPVRVSERLCVCPSAAPGAGLDVCVRLDPGLAFGTGRHPTTRLCLEWLVAWAERTRLSGVELIDYGCGSGLLAIAALKLGVARAWAVDHDPQALAAARANARRNQVGEALDVVDVQHLPPLRVDALIANILANPLGQLAPRFAGLVRPGGRLVLSGVLAEQARALERAYASWFEFETPLPREGWVRLTAIRR